MSRYKNYILCFMIILAWGIRIKKFTQLFERSNLLSTINIHTGKYARNFRIHMKYFEYLNKHLQPIDKIFMYVQMHIWRYGTCNLIKRCVQKNAIISILNGVS